MGRDWIFWTLVGFAFFQFIVIASIQTVVNDCQGRLKIMANALQKLGESQGVRLF